MDSKHPEQTMEGQTQYPVYNSGAPQLPPRTEYQGSDSLHPEGQLSYPQPPVSPNRSVSTSDISSPIHYTRDPHKLVAYLVPFPKPKLSGSAADNLPPRFLIYTPPPPPLQAPAEGEKETKVHKVQRKWQDEVRGAKTSTAKTASWQGVKSKATRGIDKAMGWTKSSNLEFINRINIDGDKDDKHSKDGQNEGDETHRTVGLEEMCLVYPPSIQSTPDQLRTEFVESMLRSKSKAQKDAVLATGLLPVSLALDVCLTLVWPFGGALEIDAVWAAANIRGAKISRNVTKRLTSSSNTGKHDEDTLTLTFTPSPRLELLDKYLAGKCHEKDAKLFPGFSTTPSETECLHAIGWAPSQHGGEAKNWEDEQFETSEVKDDLKSVMTKAASEWNKWCKEFEKNPEKAVKK